MLRKLYQDEAGVVISAELVLVLTIAVLSLVVGLSEVAFGVAHELADISDAVGNISQSYSYSGMSSNKTTTGGTKSEWDGSAFIDNADECDCSDIVLDCNPSTGEK